MNTKLYQSEFSVVIEAEVGSDRITSEVWATKEGQLNSHGDRPAVYKLEVVDGREREYRAWYRDGNLHRDDDNPAETLTDLSTGTVLHEVYSVNNLLHREGHDLPAIIHRSRATGRDIRHQFYSHNKRDRSGGPAVVQFDRDSAEETRVEHWRDGRQFEASADADRPDFDEPPAP